MDMYDSLFSPSSVLNEQIARNVFEMMNDGGPVMLIIDKDGHNWPSDSQQFLKFNISELFLRELCDKIDDGHEPVVTQKDGYDIVGCQLATERTNCGYVVLIMGERGAEANLADIDIVEILLNHVNLVARLIEKNTLLYELQMKQSSQYGQNNLPTN